MTAKSNAYQFFLSSAYLFALLGVFFMPFRMRLFSYDTSTANVVFGKIISVMTGIRPEKIVFSSDSYTLYVLMGLLLIIAIIFAAMLIRVKSLHDDAHGLWSAIRLIISYYLALQLMRYGFDKVFKGQFYLPEPNTLYTPMGKMDRDLLFWSLMGTSYAYSLFGGLMEVMAAVLLFFRRSRTVGQFLALAILLNVVVINFSFDISVKLYSLFLLFLTVVLLTPKLTSLYSFFFQEAKVALRQGFPDFYRIPWMPVRTAIKMLIVGLLVVEAVYPAIRYGNFNDDEVPRPYLHGAYEVFRTSIAGNEICYMEECPVKRFFVHREGYLVFQDHKDRMWYRRLYVNQFTSQLATLDEKGREESLDFIYNPKDSLLSLQYFADEHEYRLSAKAMNWRDLPALQTNFHWTVDREW